MTAFIAPLALLLERWLGYPQRLTDLIGHPVIWIGRFIAFMERGVDKRERTPHQRREAGMVTLAVLLLVTLAIALVVQHLLRSLPFGWVLEILVATPFLAQKELGRAVEAVASALGTSLDAGREAVSHIVGRDPQALDEAACPAPPSRPWPKAPPMAWSRPGSGWCCSACRASRSTRPSTHQIR